MHSIQNLVCTDHLPLNPICEQSRASVFHSKCSVHSGQFDLPIPRVLFYCEFLPIINLTFIAKKNVFTSKNRIFFSSRNYPNQVKMSDKPVDLKKLCIMGVKESDSDDFIRQLCESFGRVVHFNRPQNKKQLAFPLYQTER